MYPILLKIGPLTIYSYGAMLAVAVVVCAYLLTKDAALIGIKKDIVYDLMFWVVVGGIIGARIFYLLISLDYFVANPLEILMINRGGLAWQGGFLGGFLSGLWYVRKHKLSLRTMLDLCAPYLALGQSIGRIGCLFNGCCYGKVWVFGLYFPVHSARLHPTQMYETLGLLLIFIILTIAQNKFRRPGMIFALYLWLAAIERFIVEFYRADHDQLWWGLSLFQYISLLIFAGGIVAFLRFRK